ncbi:hypothetical protein HID58_057664 [Brassica napus]|uniref:BnaC03g70530D protein n=4 Tax=Brassica napus TaxID=3708 RepID=A0A078FAZ7_BRANA|nr:hypothetical protein HID58_057664 [Brassica napus]CAF1712851.1 unnamed protein product [Brassica napus]CDY10561.1 BnaC03g70530D [Brassica napus]
MIKFRLIKSGLVSIWLVISPCSSSRLSFPPTLHRSSPSSSHCNPSIEASLHSKNAMDATNAFDSVISCSLLPLSFDVFSSARHLQAHLGAKISRERSDAIDATDAEVALGTSKKNRLASANANALKLSCELLKSFVSEAVQRAAIIAEAEGMDKIEASHFERILPQLLLDF